MNTRLRAEVCRPDLPAFARVLCAVDLRQPTAGAIGLAAMIANNFGASLEALYVTGGEFDPHAEQRLSGMVQGLGGLASASARLASGSPARAIVERATQTRSDLIVLGARARSDLGWQFRDDVARDVSALADCATLTARDSERPTRIQHILVPVDLGPASLRSVQWASALALRFGAKVQLLHVVSRERRAVNAADWAELAVLERSVASLGITVDCSVTVAAGAVSGIESHDAKGDFDLVVMGVEDAPHDAPRLTRGVIATLRGRLAVPLLSVRIAALPEDMGPRARIASGRRSRASSYGVEIRAQAG